MRGTFATCPSHSPLEHLAPTVLGQEFDKGTLDTAQSMGLQAMSNEICTANGTRLSP